MDEDTNHNMNEEDDGDELSIKQEKPDLDQHLDIIERFLETGFYPANMKGQPDRKANLRKMCKNIHTEGRCAAPPIWSAKLLLESESESDFRSGRVFMFAR